MEKDRLLSRYNLPSKPSSDGYYHVYLADPGKKSGRRQIKARDLDNLKEKIYEHERGLNGNTRKSFKEAFEIVQKEKLKYVKDPEKKLSVSNTLAVNQSSYLRFFEGTDFENLFVDEITKSDIENLCLETLTRLDMGTKAFLSMRGILKSVFKLAFEQYWIDEDPYARVDFKKFNYMLLRPTPSSKRVHSASELSQMLDYMHDYQEKKPDYIPAYALELQLLMGLRRAEIAPLEWTDIIDDNCIRISKEQITVKKSAVNAKEYFRIVNHTKTYVDRDFPITEDIKDFLARLRKVHDTYFPGSRYLFPDSSNPKKVINNNVVYHFYFRMCRKLRIHLCREAMKGPHSFRRNGITKVSNSADGNLLIASMLYGNSPEAASKYYYTGIDLEKARLILEKG